MTSTATIIIMSSISVVLVMVGVSYYLRTIISKEEVDCQILWEQLIESFLASSQTEEDFNICFNLLITYKETFKNCQDYIRRTELRIESKLNSLNRSQLTIDHLLN